MRLATPAMPATRRGGPRVAKGPRKKWTPPPGAARRLVGLAEAAAYLGISPWSVRELQWDGQLKRVNISRRLLFDLHDLDELIKATKE